jgi:hypothetical protein
MRREPAGGTEVPSAASESERAAGRSGERARSRGRGLAPAAPRCAQRWVEERVLLRVPLGPRWVRARIARTLRKWHARVGS